MNPRKRYNYTYITILITRPCVLVENNKIRFQNCTTSLYVLCFNKIKNGLILRKVDRGGIW